MPERVDRRPWNRVTGYRLCNTAFVNILIPERPTQNPDERRNDPRYDHQRQTLTQGICHNSSLPAPLRDNPADSFLQLYAVPPSQPMEPGQIQQLTRRAVRSRRIEDKVARKPYDVRHQVRQFAN